MSVTVTDNGNGQQASGAAATGSDGKITFQWSGVGAGSYTTCVTNVVHASFTWNQAAGHASSGNCHTESV